MAKLFYLRKVHFVFTFLCLNIDFRQSSFARKCCVFTRSTCNQKPVLDVLNNVFVFQKSWFIENVPNLQWLSHKDIPIWQRRNLLKSLVTFLDEPGLFLLALNENLY